MNLYSLRTMLRALEQLKSARTFLLTMFFSAVEIHTTETVDIDIYKGKRRLAPFVNPNLQAKLVDQLGYKTYTYKPPYIKPKMVTTAGDLLIRQPGEIIYGSGATRESRAAEKLTKELAELDDMITRREEWMAAQALQTGKVVAIGDGVNDTIDFLMAASHLPVLTGTALWSAPTTAQPLKNLRTWKRLIAQDAGVNANVCIMSSDAYDNFIANTKEISGVNGLMNQRMVEMGKISPTELGNGVTYVGRINEVGVDIYTYDEWYVDTDNTEKPMIQSGKVILGSTQARATRHYGAIKDLKALNSMARFPKVWEEEDPSVRNLMVQSAPLTVPHQIDGFVCATVL